MSPPRLRRTIRGLRQSQSFCLCPQVKILSRGRTTTCGGCERADAAGLPAPPPCPECGLCGRVHVGSCVRVPRRLGQPKAGVKPTAHNPGARA